jgi:hypothetical protein
VDVSTPELADVANPGSSSGSAVSSFPSNGSSLGGGSRSKVRLPQIEFLCPNGHHLHGPASLQGRPGECPECGSRFRIPTYDEGPADMAPDEEISLAGLDDQQAPDPESSPVEEPLEIARLHDVPFSAEAEPALPPSPVSQAPEPIPLLEPEPILLDADAVPLEAEPVPIEPAGIPAAVRHPLGELFAQIWADRGEAARVELHLTGGDVLVVDGFAKALSQRSHGVFGIKEPDGTYTLTVAPWDLIARVVVRGMRELPAEMKE